MSQDLEEEFILELTGMVLGYAEAEAKGWTFHRPRRLPEHLTEVYRVDPNLPEVALVMQTLMASQLGQDGLYVGDLLAGEQALVGVKVFCLPMRCRIIWGCLGGRGRGRAI